MRALCLVAVLLAAVDGSVRADDATNYRVDVVHSHATFAVTHLYLTRVTGAVPIVGGEVTLAPRSAIPEAITATLDPKRIATGDGDRDDDLQGADWFDTTHFPTWTFRSVSVTAKANDAFVVAGTLTTHGVGQPMTLDVTTTGALPHPAYHAVGHVDRHAFGMRLTPTDGLIGSDVTITLDVQLR